MAFFQSACCGGQIEVVKKMLAENVWLTSEVLNMADWSGATPLHSACYAGHVEVVEVLLADPRWDAATLNQPDHVNCRTPLGAACVNGHLHIAQMLLKHPLLADATLNTVDHVGVTLFNSVCEFWRRDVFCLLLGDPRLSADSVNGVGAGGRTALHTLCLNQRFAEAKMLLLDSRLAPGSLNRPDNGGRTPFSLALSAGWLKMGKLLLATTTVDRVSFCIQTATAYRGDFVALATRFNQSPREVRCQCRLAVGLAAQDATRLFAQVIFLAEGLLCVPSVLAGSEVRFFTISQRLPLELQMLLCWRAVGDGHSETMGTKLSEPAFRALAGVLQAEG